MKLTDLKKQERYNLFVVSGEDAWESDSYIMMRARCLGAPTSQEIKTEFAFLDEEAISKIKSYPCIFAYEDPSGKDAYLGYITDMVVRDKGIKFSFEKIGKVSKEDIHRSTFELDILMPEGITELMRTHWTIKEVNLFRELEKNRILDNFQPKVFISYCWKPQENKERVLRLADRLKDDGVDVVMDKTDLHPGQDMNVFMERLSTDPDIKKVLVICTAEYVKKANAREGGVGTESEIIIPQVYGRPMQQKIIPLFFEKDENGDLYRPIYLSNRCGIDFSDEEEGYRELIENIFG